MNALKPLALVGLVGIASLLASTSANGAGGDVLLSGINGDVATFGPVGGVNAYIIGSNTCNIGDQNIAWSSGGTPALAMTAFRLHNGRLQQIGVGMLKTACCAFQDNGCNLSCVPSSGLGAGCLDTYDAGWNSFQSNLKPRKNVNAFTGAFFGTTGVSSSTVINGRTQVQQADMSTATYPGALFFLEGQYICTEDANNGNWTNNASYHRITLNASFVASPTGALAVGKPAINAWRDHGLGIGMPDTNVIIQNVDVPGEGRFIVASKVTQTPTPGIWRYEYGIHNFNSDRSAGSFRVPLPGGAIVSNIGFSDVWYHGDDAIYDGTNWAGASNGYELRWSTTQTYAQNINANAIRWGTMYNFWFDCDRAPVTGQAEIDLFKPVSPPPAPACQALKVAFNVRVPGAACESDISRNGQVDINDLLEVINGWGPCTCAANCPSNVDTTGGNTAVDINDLLKVINTWGGCP